MSLSRFRQLAKLLPLGAILVAATVMSGQHPMPVRAPLHAIDDWTHHRLVFSNPGTPSDAIHTGTYARWAKIAGDPRFVLQQRKRAAAARTDSHPTLRPPANETAKEIEAPPAQIQWRRFPRRPERQYPRGVTPAIALGNEKYAPPRRVFP